MPSGSSIDLRHKYLHVKSPGIRYRSQHAPQWGGRLGGEEATREKGIPLHQCQAIVQAAQIEVERIERAKAIGIGLCGLFVAATSLSLLVPGFVFVKLTVVVGMFGVMAVMYEIINTWNK